MLYHKFKQVFLVEKENLNNISNIKTRGEFLAHSIDWR